MVDMIKKDILPAACAYMKDISKEAINKKQLCADISCELEETLLKKLSQLTADLYKEMEALGSCGLPGQRICRMSSSAQNITVTRC